MTPPTTKPLIGIIMGYQPKTGAPTLHIGEAYIKSVLKAGGLPLLLPIGTSDEVLEEMLEMCDGLMITGGPDLDPLLFQDNPDSRAGGVDPRRDASEAFLINSAAQKKMPILGICRGIQALNVTLGGTLYIDLSDDYPGSEKHDFYPDMPRDAYRHTIAIEKDTILFEIMGKNEIQVNSLHHQGVKDPAPNLTIAGLANDGSIEALVAKDHPWCVGVQWHPECLPDDQDAQSLFTAFVQAANNFHQLR
jgi:putative glutamine amidotransferase